VGGFSKTVVVFSKNNRGKPAKTTVFAKNDGFLRFWAVNQVEGGQKETGPGIPRFRRCAKLRLDAHFVG
jgi:hypothetical protein